MILLNLHLDSGAPMRARVQIVDNVVNRKLVRDGYANPALDKLLAAIGGWADVGTRLRWPYRWIEPDVAARLRPVAQAMLPELFR